MSAPAFHSRIPAIAGIVLVLLLASCRLGGRTAAQTPELPTGSPVPAGPETLNICMGREPQSLYLYGDNSQAARVVRQAIYDGAIETANYQTETDILEGLPGFDNGALSIQTVAVNPGDRIVDANGLVTLLQAGTLVRPAGCRDANCATAYEGGELVMEQVSATFKLRPGITWSDGTALTAQDSVYSFEIASDIATPGPKTRIERTASYEAVDEFTVVWTGLPGYIDSAIPTFFWIPLPRHAWEDTAPADLPESQMASRTPMGWGAYMITEWVAGQRITFERNANYWRAADGLPYFNTLNILFVGEGGSAVDALADGRCDLLLPSTNLESQSQRLREMADSGQAQFFIGSAGSWEHLDFSVQPRYLDDGFNVFNDGPDWFGDARMRQAFAQCVDRQALIEQFAFGQGLKPATYLPQDHPLGSPNLVGYDYDPTAAGELLTELGWLPGPDGVRLASTYPGALVDTRLELTLTIADEERTLAIAHSLQNSLDDCGIALLIESLPQEQLFAGGPEGPLFGRSFQLAQFAWPHGEQPACYLYLGEAIPGEDFEVYRYGWGGWNLSGWSNPEFDAACQHAQNSLPGEAGYVEGHQTAQAIFAEQLPALPLFANMQIAAARADFCNFALDAGTDLLKDLETLGFGEWCE